MNSIHFTLKVMAILLAISTALFIPAFLLNTFSRSVRQSFSRIFGHQTFLWVFRPGIAIHEFGHWITANLFLYQVTAVKWWDINARDGAHGYVQMRRKNVPFPLSLWQFMGALFIGTAPLYVGPLLLLASLKYLVPGGSSFVHHPSIKNLPVVTYQLLIWFYFTLATLVHVELSAADLEGSWKGFLATLLIVAAIAVTYTRIHSFNF